MPPAKAATPRKTAADRRARLVARLWRAAEGQMRALEARLATLEPDTQPGETEAKLLAGLARLVRELAALDADATAKGEATHGTEAQSSGRRIDALRAEIARRLAGLDPSAADAADRDAEAGGDPGSDP